MKDCCIAFEICSDKIVVYCEYHNELTNRKERQMYDVNGPKQAKEFINNFIDERVGEVN